MKNALRTSALFCAATYLSLSLSSAPAFASNTDQTNDMVHNAQLHLASLGYYVGRYDGLMGVVTEKAVTKFQRNNDLPITGRLDPVTYNLLIRTDYAYDGYYHSTLADGFHHVAYGEPVFTDARAVAWDDRWHYVRAQNIPTRFGKLDVSEDNRGSLRHYSVTLNGKPVLIAKDQPGILRVSQTFQLRQDDNIVFTAYVADDACASRNYLLTIHSDGSYTPPREIGNCASSYEAHTAGDALFISFPQSIGIDGLAAWDVWRYENNNLVHI